MLGTTLARALRRPTMHGVWARVSLLGEKLGSDALTYNPGIFRAFHQAALRNAPPLVDAVLARFPDARTLVDVGCGTGVFAAEFQRRGLRVVGLEYARRARRWAERGGVHVLPFDVARDPAVATDIGTFDVALSTEVAEHLPPTLADRFVDLVASLSSRIVFTAAQPDGRAHGNGHVNEQPKAYWIAKFAARGLAHDDDAAEVIAAQLRDAATSHYMHENMMVFRR
jgi:2-polyprenyl-3-methyl-5-hydroxy-6-metoxy-1,4-benzoquinol methylase